MEGTRPSDAQALIPLKIEEDLYHAIAPLGKALDTPFRYVQNALGKGLQPLATVWYKVIKCQPTLQKINPDENTTIDIALGLHFDLKK